MPTLLEMLEAGVHFGHKKERSHPKARNYTFTLREGIYVIDLEKTAEALIKAEEFLKKQTQLGKTILLVGTKRQAKEIIKKVALSTGMPYVNKRFLGGTLTNFETIRKNITQLESLENQMKSEEFAGLTKKEKKIIADKHDKLLQTFDGVRSMKTLPDVLFVIDANHEDLAIREAIIKEIPVVAITDTDANPQHLTYPIFANDDAPKSLEMVMKIIEKAMLGANTEAQNKEETQKVSKDTETQNEDKTQKVSNNAKAQNEDKTQKVSKAKTKPAS